MVVIGGLRAGNKGAYFLSDPYHFSGGILEILQCQNGEKDCDVPPPPLNLFLLNSELHLAH